MQYHPVLLAVANPHISLVDGLGAGVVIEACGVPSTINEGIKLLRRGGRFMKLVMFWMALAR